MWFRSGHLLFPRPSEHTEDCVSLFFTPLVSAQPQARGNCPHVCCWTANGVKDFYPPLAAFLVLRIDWFIHLAPAQKSDYAHLIFVHVLDLENRSWCAHTSGSLPIPMPQFHSSASFVPHLSIFSPLERMHDSNSPVAVLVCVQVSQPMAQWGRCRCKWISSLTLAPESTKSAWKVRFSSALGRPVSPSMEE